MQWIRVMGRDCRKRKAGRADWRAGWKRSTSLISAGLGLISDGGVLLSATGCLNAGGLLPEAHSVVLTGMHIYVDNKYL